MVQITLQQALTSHRDLLGPEYGQLGKSHKIYLSYDQNKGWSVTRFTGCLGWVQQILRWLGLYSATHLATVARQLQKEANVPPALQAKIQRCWSIQGKRWSSVAIDPLQCFVFPPIGGVVCKGVFEGGPLGNSAAVIDMSGQNPLIRYEGRSIAVDLLSSDDDLEQRLKKTYIELFKAVKTSCLAQTVAVPVIKAASPAIAVRVVKDALEEFVKENPFIFDEVTLIFPREYVREAMAWFRS